MNKAPFSASTETTKEPIVLSRWEGQELIWTINGGDVTDRDLRNWCANNMRDSDPSRWVDLVRACHVKAWAEAHQ